MIKSDYRSVLSKEKNPYLAWINSYEEKLPEKEIDGDVSKLFLSLGYRLIKVNGGRIDPLLYEYVSKAIYANWPDVIYTDEDVESGFRYRPYFKPDFSPDTLEGFFYVGGLLVIKETVLKEFAKNQGDGIIPDEINEDNYGLLKEFLMHVFYKERAVSNSLCKNIVHIPKVLFHADKECDYLYKEIPAKKSVLDAKLSVVILSKDNPEMLFANINSLLRSVGKEKADDCFEIIVVDNGSIENNRIRIEQFLSATGAKYLHQTRAFEYSTLCNIGANEATGDYLLFLNDDVIFGVDDKNSVAHMLYYAKKPHVGAVGMKLYFPDEGVEIGDENLFLYKGLHRIQHAGISLMVTGPSHKLQTYLDDKDYYFGRNSRPYDVLAVTGAALMVKKEKFDLVGGFDNRLKIAYTDVDLCNDLKNKGYYNVCLNDICAYHFESVSRGNDVIVKEKANRLKNERKIFMEKHDELLIEGDMFVGPNITKIRLDYSVGFNQDWENLKFVAATDSVPYKDLIIKGIREAKDGVLLGNIDRISYIPTSSDNLPTYYEIEGWMIMHKADQTLCEMYLGVSDGKVLRYYPVVNKYRSDLNTVFEKEKNVELSGFVVRIKDDEFERYITYKLCMIMSRKSGLFNRESILYKETDSEICLGETVR